LFFSSDLIAVLLGDSTLSSLIKLSALTIPPCGILFILIGSLEGLGKFGKSATIAVVYSTLRVIFVVLLVYYGLEIYGAIIGLVLAVFFSALVSAFFCRGQDFEGEVDTFLLIKFAFPVLLFYVGNSLIMNIDMLFTKSYIISESKIGFYASAQTLSRAIFFSFSAFSAVLLPSISAAIANNDLDLIKRKIKQTLRYMLMFLLPICFIISATSKQFITLFYGTSYVDAAYPLSILIFGISFLSITLSLSAIIQGYGAPKIPLAIFLILVPIDIGLLLYLIPKLELLGAALATSITCFTGLIITCIYIYWKFNALFKISSFLKISFASFFTYLIAMKFSASGIFLLIFYLSLFTIYILILFILREINNEDISFFKGILQKFSASVYILNF
jgi:stage V sporulation protein B